MQDVCLVEPVGDNFFVATGSGSCGSGVVFVELILPDGFLQGGPDGIELVDSSTYLVGSTEG
jgi:hypothetical protein